MKKTFLALVVGALLTGCAVTVPVIVRPEGVTDTQFQQDDYSCLRKATLNPLALWNPEKLYRMCMEEKGYNFK